MSEALVLASLVRTIAVLIADAGDDTSRKFLEFFTAKTWNRNTRTALVAGRAGVLPAIHRPDRRRVQHDRRPFAAVPGRRPMDG